MANNKNLKPQAHKLTVEEQSKGGRVSARIRRETKELRQCAKEILALETMIIMDGTPTPCTYAMAIIISLLKKATNSKDRQQIQAVQTLIKLTGADKLEEESALIRAQIDLIKARTEAITRCDESDNMSKLDDILEEMKIAALNEECNYADNKM